MSTILKSQVEIEIAISELDYPNRCSRDCPFCYKENGLYQCFLPMHKGMDYYADEIEGEGLEDIDGHYNTADSYGFTRTKRCHELFPHPQKGDEA